VGLPLLPASDRVACSTNVDALRVVARRVRHTARPVLTLEARVRPGRAADRGGREERAPAAVGRASCGHLERNCRRSRRGSRPPRPRSRRACRAETARPPEIARRLWIFTRPSRRARRGARQFRRWNPLVPRPPGRRGRAGSRSASRRVPRADRFAGRGARAECRVSTCRASMPTAPGMPGSLPAANFVDARSAVLNLKGIADISAPFPPPMDSDHADASLVRQIRRESRAEMKRGTVTRLSAAGAQDWIRSAVQPRSSSSC
jgi:hypothetical protein